MHELLQGHWHPRFDKVAAALADEITRGEEVGAAIAIDIDGELVVDMWGGHADAAKTLPWTRDTIVNVWSSTKTVTALAALMLIDRGLVEPEAPVATYWPEFAANGKQHIEFRHLMSHTSGVSGWDQPVVVEDVFDWDKSTSALAAQSPWWEPGTASGYHALNYGHLIGEVLRRVTGKSLKEFVRDEIAGPLGADFQIGAIPADDDRIAEIIPATEPLDLPPMDQWPAPMLKTFTGPAPDPAVANTADWRAADIGGANGHGNARSLARILSAISLGGTVDGVALLRPQTIDRIFEIQSDGPDLVLANHPLKWGLGFGLPQPETIPFVPDGRICFWGGWGGSFETMNPDRRTTVAYVMNKMGPGIEGSARTDRYFRLIYEALA
ncbi:serine hydrolase [Mycolicibacterium moriokaense]|jgi:CubicO group peptidase (beta-lactamase class C family)|uniref:EstA family serine hydrolase n=1 Tax=Mycolicibacterium moriokaense TaxID=39691 RepID=A0AAD1H7M7_9MYCO|nr:serine hydrolase domain-containing protein [Mycolicibacterium moriokaense]MCV7040161.1 beta-lactamase family protein [Mycolicibacterium moriokaense]ORB20115.1 serine hydrolase [Mycolicibacterium moriokaense]BBX00175.1 EstA family serine hydrolase [Mycolicibacterium moriokaense]